MMQLSIKRSELLALMSWSKYVSLQDVIEQVPGCIALKINGYPGVDVEKWNELKNKGLTNEGTPVTPVIVTIPDRSWSTKLLILH